MLISQKSQNDDDDDDDEGWINFSVALRISQYSMLLASGSADTVVMAMNETLSIWNAVMPGSFNGKPLEFNIW